MVLVAVMLFFLMAWAGVFKGSGQSGTPPGISLDDPKSIAIIQRYANLKADVPSNGIWHSDPELLYCPADTFDCSEVTYKVSVLSGADVKELEAHWVVAIRKTNGTPAYIRTLNPFARAGFEYPSLAQREDIYMIPQFPESARDTPRSGK